MRMYRASGRIACSMAVVALALGSSAGGQAPSGTSATVDWPLLSPGMHVAVYRGFPEPGALTGFTVGLSHFHPPGGAHKELTISMRDSAGTSMWISTNLPRPTLAT